MRYSREPASVLHRNLWGQIRFASEDDDGTATPDKPTAWRDASRAVPHLLIVEDELFVAWELEAMVEDFGYVLCAVASRGEEAIQKAEEREPDLALVDVNLGG